MSKPFSTACLVSLLFLGCNLFGIKEEKIQLPGLQGKYYPINDNMLIDTTEYFEFYGADSVNHKYTHHFIQYRYKIVDRLLYLFHDNFNFKQIKWVNFHNDTLKLFDASPYKGVGRDISNGIWVGFQNDTIQIINGIEFLCSYSTGQKFKYEINIKNSTIFVQNPKITGCLSFSEYQYHFRTDSLILVSPKHIKLLKENKIYNNRITTRSNR